MSELARITFEGGNLNEFDSVVSDGGRLSASNDSANEGSWGMEAEISSTTAIYGQVDFADKTRLRIGYYFHPNSVSMSDGDDFYLTIDSVQADYVIRLKKSGTDYKLYAGQYDDSSTWQFTGEATLSNAWHWIEVDFERSSGPGNDDGRVRVWIDPGSPPFGSPDVSKTDIDDDTRDYDDAQIGAAGSIEETVEGTIYFDYIVINDDGSEIGPYLAPLEIAIMPSEADCLIKGVKVVG